MKELTITAQIEAEAIKIIGNYPKGVRWADLSRMIQKSNPSFHPKTINGIVWKLPQKYPDKILKNNGLFLLIR